MVWVPVPVSAQRPHSTFGPYRNILRVFRGKTKRSEGRPTSTRKKFRGSYTVSFAGRSPVSIGGETSSLPTPTVGNQDPSGDLPCKQGLTGHRRRNRDIVSI